MTDFYAQLEEQLLVAGRRRKARGPARRALAGRGRVLALACVAFAAVGATAVAVIGGSDSSAVGIGTPAAPREPALPVPGDLEGIRVAVLNGTTERGGARATAEDLAALGARITSISNVSDPGGARTEVRYKRGASAEARRVAGVLGVRRVTPYTTSPPTMAQVDVIVLVGADGLRRTKPSPGPPVATVPRAPAAPPPGAATVPGGPGRVQPAAPAPAQRAPSRARPPTAAPVKAAPPGAPAKPSRIVTVPAAPAPAP